MLPVRALRNPIDLSFFERLLNRRARDRRAELLQLFSIMHGRTRTSHLGSRISVTRADFSAGFVLSEPASEIGRDLVGSHAAKGRRKYNAREFLKSSRLSPGATRSKKQCD